MRNRKFTYEGTLDQLRADVAETGIRGDWQKMPRGYWRYRTKDGAILNWWPSTDALNFQGPQAEAAHLEQRLFEVTRGGDASTEYRGNILHLMFEVAQTGIPGKWQLKPAGTWRFRTSDRAVLTWNESTQALSFSGPRDAAARLEQRLFEVGQRNDEQEPGRS